MKSYWVLIVFLAASCGKDADIESGSKEQLLHQETYDRFEVDVRKWRKEVIDIDSIEVSGDFLLTENEVINFECNPVYQLIHPKITLNSKTSASEFGLVFPESAKLTLASGNTWSGKVEVFAKPNKNDPRVWVLYFRNELLNSAELKNPFSVFKKCPPND